MDTGRLRRELVSTVRLLWSGERWLWPGLVVTVAAYGLWVAATGAALAAAARFAGQPISVAEWSTATTAAVAVVAVAWVLVPAVLAASLIDDRVTNLRGNVEGHYRLDHPGLLFVVPAALFLAGLGTALALGRVPLALAAGMIVVGVLSLVRCLAFSYRVFSLSAPLAVRLGTVLAAAVIAVTALVQAGLLAGRRAFVENAAAGVGDLLGVEGAASLATGSTAVAGVSVPTLPGLAAATPVAFAVGYLVAQTTAGLLARWRGPEVRRSELRTGQRYPEFARPTTAGAGGQSTAPPDTSHEPDRPEPSSPGSEAEPADQSDDSDEDSVSHTRVFRPPDGEGGGGPATEGAAATASQETGGAYDCPSCGDTYGSDASFAYCPNCGTELERR